jgi:hypothetical protein
MSQLIANGPLALKDLGTNTTSNTLHDSGAGGLSLSSDNSFGLFRPHQTFYDDEVNAWEYDFDQIVDGTAYVYKKNSSSAYTDGGHGQSHSYTYHGNTGAIGNNLISYMSSSAGAGNQAYQQSALYINASSSTTQGSISSSKQSYTSLNGDTRTISDIGYVQNTNINSGNGADQDKGNLIWFGLVGNVPNNDNDAFYNLTLYNSNGNAVSSLLRSQATREYDGSVTVWTWDSISDSSMTTLGTSVNRFLLTNSTVVTFTNGISEEMSGGTDTNPIEFSDYYKDADFHNTTGIPTSGTIKFSEFYGKTRFGTGGTSVHSTAWVAEFAWNYVSFDGFWDNGGSMTDRTFTYPSTSTTATITTVYAINGGSQSFFLALSGGAFSNSGWTNLKIWLNQSSNSGSPDYTFTRSSASHSTSGSGSTATTTWAWNGYSNLSFAGGNTIGDTQNNYLVID